MPIILALLTSAFSTGSAEARNRAHPDSDALTPIAEAAPTLAPFQHVRFCLHYPSDCQSSADEKVGIELDPQTIESLKRINRGVNLSIAPRIKSYGQNIQDGWTIGPETGDCNDYAVTKRHELIQSGLSSRALRLSVVKTPAGVGHLVLVVVTTRGDMVLDNLTDTIRPWRNTGYEWLKIQSASNAKFWHEIKSPEADPTLAQVDRRTHVADQ